MIKQIPFNPTLAMKAWKLPEKGDKFYLLFQRNGCLVLPYAYDENSTEFFPFYGKVWQYHSAMKHMDLSTNSWAKDGRYKAFGPDPEDLILYEGEIETVGGRAKRGKK